MMKAIVQREYGDPEEVLGVEDTGVPAVADDRVLVRVHASSVNPADWHNVTGTPYLVRVGGGGIRRPKQTIPGVDFAGRVESVGKAVTRFQPGDEVYGMCRGAFAEYLDAHQDRIALKPAKLTFEQAASVPVAAFTALQGLREKGRIQPGHRVLINGASGGVGTFAVQIAKAFGTEVTGVCSTRNVEMVRGLGADRVIDYTQDDFARTGDQYDLILDIAGTRSNVDRRRAMAPKATLVVIGGPKANRWIGPAGSMLRAVLMPRTGGRRVAGMIAKNSVEDLDFLRGLFDDGRVTPVVEQAFPLDELPAALRQVGAGHCRGKLVISIQPA